MSITSTDIIILEDAEVGSLYRLISHESSYLNKYAGDIVLCIKDNRFLSIMKDEIYGPFALYDDDPLMVKFKAIKVGELVPLEQVYINE